MSTLTVADVAVTDDDTRKFLIDITDRPTWTSRAGAGIGNRALPDARVEAVLFRLVDSAGAEHWCACLSVFQGCPERCQHCATATIDPVVPLLAEEITGQLPAVLAHPDAAPAAGPVVVTLAAEGDAMLNPRAAHDACAALLRDPGVLRVSVSTIGRPRAMALFDDLPVQFYVSAHVADPNRRAWLIPTSTHFPLPATLAAAARHTDRTGIRSTAVMVLFRGWNDGPEDVHALCDLLDGHGGPDRFEVMVNTWNRTGRAPGAAQLAPVGDAALGRAAGIVERRGYLAKRRPSAGGAVAGCGTLDNVMASS